MKIKIENVTIKMVKGRLYFFLPNGIYGDKYVAFREKYAKEIKEFRLHTISKKPKSEFVVLENEVKKTEPGTIKYRKLLAEVYEKSDLCSPICIDMFGNQTKGSSFAYYENLLNKMNENWNQDILN